MRAVQREGLHGELVRSLPAPSRTYRKGRVCAAQGCDARLSIYNASRLCWQHEPMRTYTLRAPKKRWAA
jgi:hypothetical protein